MRSIMNLETRAFLPEYADKDMNSPGEPGVTYAMGSGFATELASGSRGVADLAPWRATW